MWVTQETSHTARGCLDLCGRKNGVPACVDTQEAFERAEATRRKNVTAGRAVGFWLGRFWDGRRGPWRCVSQAPYNGSFAPSGSRMGRGAGSFMALRYSEFCTVSPVGMRGPYVALRWCDVQHNAAFAPVIGYPCLCEAGALSTAQRLNATQQLIALEAVR